MICLIFPLCAFVLNYRKACVSDILFCMFLCATGMGNYYNEVYQIGGTIVPADIYLAIFVFSYLLIYRVRCISKKTIYIFMLGIFMFLIGLLGGNQLGQILRDVKVFIYFFSAYLYIKKRKDDLNFLRVTICTLMIIVIFTAMFCAVDFITYGITGISDGLIRRTFGIGIAQYGLAATIVICIPFKEQIQKRIGNFGYYLIQFVLVFLCVVSYTRSVWVQLVASVMLYIAICVIASTKTIMKRKLAKSVLSLVFVAIMLIVVYNYFKSNYTALFNTIISRVESISAMGTGEVVGNNYDTLGYRLDDVKSYGYKYINIRILWGWGFGDVLESGYSAIVENSFLYYSWKYGVIGTIVLGYKVIANIISKIRTRSSVSIAVAVSLSMYYISGGMSGHLNKYYILPLIAYLIVVDFRKIKSMLEERRQWKRDCFHTMYDVIEEKKSEK